MTTCTVKALRRTRTIGRTRWGINARGRKSTDLAIKARDCQKVGQRERGREPNHGEIGKLCPEFIDNNQRGKAVDKYREHRFDKSVDIYRDTCVKIGSELIEKATSHDDIIARSLGMFIASTICVFSALESVIDDLDKTPDGISKSQQCANDLRDVVTEYERNCISHLVEKVGGGK